MADRLPRVGWAAQAIRSRLGAARFRSVTFRLFELDTLEERCEDYGQVATYRGTMPHAPHVHRLDDHHAFEAGRPERVCGNTAAMLSETRLAEHFTVSGDRSVHFGELPCGPTLAAHQYARADDGGACC